MRDAVEPRAVLDLLAADGHGSDLVVPLSNGEPVATLDAIEDAAERDALTGPVTVHQMHVVHDRRYLHGAFGDRMRHVSYFLSPTTRPAYAAGHIDLVPNNFSEVRDLIRLRARDPIVVCAVSPPDRHGYFSMGTNADYAASFIGRARFFVEANARMPRTFGRNQIHESQVAGWCESDRPLVEVPPIVPDSVDLAIGALVAERIPHAATIQTGIGGIPNAILSALAGHRDLGVHTELLSDGLVDLIDSGVVNGVRKRLNRTKVVATFALGTQRLYDFMADNTAIEMYPVRYVNDPRTIAQEPNFVSVNATLMVDFLGQCASETLPAGDGARYYSSSGGQADFARGAMFSDGGQGFIVVRAAARGGQVSAIVPTLPPGMAVTTLKNTVDKVVTEHGVAELRGRTIEERTKALIAIAAPDFRDQLSADAKRLGFV
jgi:acyl-CoA hydrolase